MQHPWLAEGRNKPMEPAPFPNRLTESALCRPVLNYMVERLSYRYADVVRLVTGNVPSGATATYHLLLRRTAACRHKMPIDVSCRPTAVLRRRCSDITAEKCSLLLAHPAIEMIEKINEDVNYKSKRLFPSAADSIDAKLTLCETAPEYSGRSNTSGLPPLNDRRHMTAQDTAGRDVIEKCITPTPKNGALVSSRRAPKAEEHKEAPEAMSSNHAYDSNASAVAARTVSDNKAEKGDLYVNRMMTFDLTSLLTARNPAHATLALATAGMFSLRSDYASDTAGCDVSAAANQPTGFATARCDTDIGSAAKQINDDRQTVPPSLLHHYVLNLDFQRLLHNNNVQDGVNASAFGRADAVALSPKRRLGRRQLLQPVQRSNTRSSRDQVAVRLSADRAQHGEVLHQQQPASEQPSHQPSRPSACRVVELRFKSGVNGHQYQNVHRGAVAGVPAVLHSQRSKPAVAESGGRAVVRTAATLATYDDGAGADESSLPQLQPQSSSYRGR